MNCKKCNSEFNPSKGLISYCSLKCRNSRSWSEEDKLKKSNSAKTSEKIKIANTRDRSNFKKKANYIIPIEKKCFNCNKIFFTKRNKAIFCSRKCKIGKPFNEESKIKLKKSLKIFWDKKGRKQKKCKICEKIISEVNKYDFCKNHWLESEEFKLVLGNHKNYKKGYVYNKHSNTKEYLMSSLEFDYFNFLERKNIVWFKPKPIKYEKNGMTHLYFPDFYLPNTNEYIEIKGYWWSGDKQKMKLVQEQNKDVKIILLNTEKIKRLK